MFFVVVIVTGDSVVWWLGLDGCEFSTLAADLSGNNISQVVHSVTKQYKFVLAKAIRVER